MSRRGSERRIWFMAVFMGSDFGVSDVGVLSLG